MEQRRLGTSPIAFRPIAFGGNVFGWTADEKQSFRLLDAFVDAGFTFIDTADVYSRWHPGNQGGESETIIGKWMAERGNRDRVIVATKFGMDMGDGRVGLSRRWMMQAVEDSLRRLKTDYIDLYQSHKDDPETPVEETLAGYAELIRQGKVREIGASNFEAPRLKAALEASRRDGLPRYQSMQPLYSLVERGTYEGALEDLCRAENLGVIPFYPLASGFLTGKYRSKADLEGRTRAPRVEKYLNEGGLKVLDALDDVARRHGAKPVQVALAWLLARPGITAPIVSATTPEQLAEILAAPTITLDADSIRQIDEASR